MNSVIPESTTRVEEILSILRDSDGPMSISEIRFALSGVRPGTVELEREILKHDDLFEFVAGDQVDLIDAVRDNKLTSVIAEAAFEPPSIKDLVGYYEDCIREDGRRIRAYQSHIGSNALETETEWATEKRGVYSIKVSAETRDLILNSSDGATAHYYGYPVLTQWVDADEEELLKIVPVLFWRLDRIGEENKNSHRLSFTLQANDFRLNPEVLWSIPRNRRQRIIDLFQDADTLEECLEMIQSDFLGLETKETLFQHKLPRNPSLKDLKSGDEGIFNRGLYLAITPNSFIKGLSNELSVLAQGYANSLPPCSIDALVGMPTSGIEPMKRPVAPATRPLNAYQEEAVARALNNRLSVITGPPGTGKSEVVVAIIANAILQGKSVLFASKNNGAIDVVQRRVASIFDEGGGLLRLGSMFDGDTRSKVQRIFSQPAKRDMETVVSGAKEFDEHWSKLADVLGKIDQCEELSTLAVENEKRFFEAAAQLKISAIKMLPKVFGQDDNDLLSSVVEALQSIEASQKLPFVGGWVYKRKAEKIFAQQKNVFHKLEDLCSLQPGDLSETLLNNKAKWSRTVLACLEVFGAAKEAMSSADRLKQLGSVESLLSELAAPKEAMSEQIKTKLNATLAQTLSEESSKPGFQQSARQLMDALQRKQAVRISLEHPMQQALKALPCWTVSNLSVCGRLPLTPGLFDLVLIDEASQCDIPSCIPLMFRAKQAVVIGDPMQLDPISNLSKQSEASILRRHNIEHPGSYRYSSNSIYDLAFASAPSFARTFLSQHYRCHPEIIGFANSSHWYNSNLEAVTDVSSLKKARNVHLGINWLDVDGTPSIAETGFWIPEVSLRISREVYRLLVEEGFEGTVGVVTPFRRMANAIQQQIEASGIHQNILKACEFRADTAHKFQGDERDIMFFAPCYHPQMPNKHKWFLSSQKNVFNVSLSRARSAFVVVGNKEELRVCDIDYLRDFVQYVESPEKGMRPKRSTNDSTKGHWEPVFEKSLLEKGISVEAQYPLGPYSLDFALIRDGRRLDIEIDGEQFHKDESGMRCQRDIDRNIYVKSQGWSVMRFWVYQLRDDIDECVNQVKKWWIQID